MELSISSELQEFRHEVLEFLDEVKTSRLVKAGERATSVFPEISATLEWHKILYKKGWLVPTWPEEWGGQGWSLDRKIIFEEECQLAGMPFLMPMGLAMLGPVLLHYGTEEQKNTLIPRMLSAEDIWCQGYSEPSSGSDLASLKTRAVSEGDEYIINGSKIWTSMAHHANKIFCLVKTNLDCKPQAGISFILIDLDSPGITVEKIVSNDGEVEQCQVFFDDVRVPKANLVGEENQGWQVAKHLLEFERGGGCFYPTLYKQLEKVKALAKGQVNDVGNLFTEDPAFTDKLATAEIDSLALRFLEFRIQSAAAAGKNPGALTSMQKIVTTELSQEIDQLALDARGIYVGVHMNETLAPDYDGEYVGSEEGAPVTNHYLNNLASTIYGGTAQVQRNIIAKLVLGL